LFGWQPYESIFSLETTSKNTRKETRIPENSIKASHPYETSQDSLVGIVTRLPAGPTRNHGSTLVKDMQLFSSPKCPDWFWVLPCSGMSEGISPWVKRPGRKADHSPPYCTEVQNSWTCIYTSASDFIAWCLIKHRDSFTLLLMIIRPA
jgi:hypothetical protein